MSTCEKSIIEFLTLHPDFLIRHPDLLRHITVPHGFQGKTVSLLEYQSDLLRKRLCELEQQYQSENLKASAHHHLSQHLHTVIRMLYECDDDQQLFDILESFLIEHYAANSIRVFAATLLEKRAEKTNKLLRPLDIWRRDLFTLILNNPKPLCDSLQYEHLVALFDKEADRVHSSLLHPFRYQGEEALLAVGSVEWQQYKQSVELDILSTVIEVLSRLTEPSSKLIDEHPP